MAKTLLSHYILQISALLAAILNFSVFVNSYDIEKCTIESGRLENMGVAAGIMCLRGLEPEIPLGVLYPPTPLATCVCKKSITTAGLTNQ